MRTFRVPRPCDPARLHDALASAGVPVITVRAASERLGELAMYAVVVTEDSAPPTTAAIIASHIETWKPSRTPTRDEMERGLQQLEKL